MLFIVERVGVVLLPLRLCFRVSVRLYVCVSALWFVSLSCSDVQFEASIIVFLPVQILVDEATKRWKHEEEVIDDITCTIIQFNAWE